MRARVLLSTSVATIICTIAVQASAQTIQPIQSIPNNVYFRADIGWSAGTSADIHDRTANNLSVNPLNAIVGSSGHAGTLDHIGDALFAGAGVGMQFTPYLRGDVVYTWRGDYNLDEVDAAGTRFKSNIWSNSVMVNGYLDFPYSGVIPYIGFGMGWAETQMGNLSATSTLVVNPLVVHPLASPSTAVAPGGSSDNFAWQIMVGLGVPIADGVMFDAFYRYFDGGPMRTNSGTVLIGNTAVGTYAGVEGALKANELGVSVRFAL